ncbi:Zinc finger, UBR-type,Zinc finger, RING/FYVE/PHD-type,Zinc finger, RING-type [Cinara cedri]|uniref:E3 ubiquitin-protein ligase n=1 Tax=Cinara cedri TaxID=506608 RepID=A0A5E4MTG9_9HEMI|nr:Zinc finger, UBR-type,Zinc finger, RING/FYVE/PHD-type,Zinc finger, RING-type [Cinara cedri]
MDTPSTSYVSQKHSCACLLNKFTEREAAAHILTDCINVDTSAGILQQSHDHEVNALTRSKLLDDLLDLTFNNKCFQPYDKFWLRFLMASGKTLEQFNSAVKDYDTGKECGFVWLNGFVVYTCHTCKFSSGISVCGDCFKHGDHIGHDAHLFLSQEIGVCHCGNINLMKLEGCCSEHRNPNTSVGNTYNKKQSPADLFRVTKKLMPRLLLKLVQILREYSSVGNIDTEMKNELESTELDGFLSMLFDLIKLGTAMQQIMTVSFTDKKIYQWACNYHSNPCEHSSPVSIILEDEDDTSGYSIKNELNNGKLYKQIKHTNFLEEIVFWSLKYEFSQQMVFLLLYMLPDANFKKALIEAFCKQYSIITHLMETAKNHETISKNLVYISSQLFGNEDLALLVVNQQDMLRVTLSNLRSMMKKILVPSTLHNWINNTHYVVEWSDNVLREHRFWPLTNDLNLMLNCEKIAIKFIHDDHLLNLWFSYLSRFQGMNVNVKELNDHVEYERTKFNAFSIEFKVCFYTLRVMLLHFTSTNTLPHAYIVLRASFNNLRQWLMNIGCILNYRVNRSSVDSSFNVNYIEEHNTFSFHLPMHRFLAGFLSHTVRSQGICIKSIIPYSSAADSIDRDALLLAISSHPLHIQAVFYEIMQKSWIRNGGNIKRQAKAYFNPEYSSYMVDTDLYLLQLCLSELSDANKFMCLTLEKFNAYKWMNFIKYRYSGKMYSQKEDVARNIGNVFVFLTTLVGVRTNLCSDEMYNYCQFNLEMITLLCLSKRTHSQLMASLPKRYSNYIPTSPYTSSTHQLKTVLQSIAEYKKPNIDIIDKLHKGHYVPLAHTWQNLYDPVHVLLRAGNRSSFQTSMDHYTDCMQSIGILKKNQTPWPPYRTPHQQHPAYNDPRRVLLSRLFHTVTWHCLYQLLVYEFIDEHVLSLVIHLIDQAWIYYYSSTVNDIKSRDCSLNTEDNIYKKKQIKIPSIDDKIQDWKLLIDYWFDDDDLVKNLCTTITTDESGTSSSIPDGLKIEENHTKNEHSSLPINESIISLLLRIHSNLSNKPDSYQPPSPTQTTDLGLIGKMKSTNQFSTVANDHHEKEIETSPCGDGVYYIGRLLDKMTIGSTLCYECVSRTRLELWPRTMIVNETTQKEEDNKKRKRKLAVMEEMAKCQQAFIESTHNLGDLDSSDIHLQPNIYNNENVQCDKLAATETFSINNATTINIDHNSLSVDCAICKKSMVKEMKPNFQYTDAVGLVIFVQGTNILAHRRHLLTQPKTTNTSYKNNDIDSHNTEDKQNYWPTLSLLQQYNETSYASHYERRSDLITQYYNNLNENDLKIGAVTTTTNDSAQEISGNVHIQTCGHYLHCKCLDKYLKNLSQNQSTRLGYACPVCWQISNSVLPLMSSIKPHCDISTSSTSTLLTDVISKLTELIEQDDIRGNSHRHHIDINENNCLLDYANKCVNHMIDISQRLHIVVPDTTVLVQQPLTMASKRAKHFNEKWQSIMSVAWTNIQMEVVVEDKNKLSKKTCIGPLLKVLHLSAQSLLAEYSKSERNPLYDIWYKLIGSELAQEFHPPLLMRDPCIILLQLVFLFPTLQPEQFDSLVKLAYNMQIYTTALKVATEIECHDYNNKTGMYKYSNSDISALLSSINMTQFKKASLTSQPTQSFFSNAVVLAINVMFSSQTDHVLRDDRIMNDNDEIFTSDENENMLESYARQSSLPFLRFAAILKKYTYGNDYLEECNVDSITQSSSTLSNKTQQSKLCKRRKVNINNSTDIIKPCHSQNQQLCRDHWSQDDYEFQTLAQYLKLLNDKHNNLPCAENNIGVSQADGNIVQCSTLVTSFKPPSVMKAVFWPKSSNIIDTEYNFTTTIPRAWLISFRESLAIKIGKRSKITNLVDIPMATRLLLGMDCCGGGGGPIKETSNGNNGRYDFSSFINWTGPRLLGLPNLYSDVFYSYYNRPCIKCSSVPRQPAICLVCGTIVCSRSICCIENKPLCEGVQHSRGCGNGTGIFLDIRTCSVIVIRDKYYCFWGSLYLDEHGEDDFNIERGIPLRLNTNRYKLLERQWLTHRLDFVKRQWMLHNNKF